MQTAVAVKEPTRAASHSVRARIGSRARNPTPIVVPKAKDPEPSKTLINQVNVYWSLYEDAGKFSVKSIRAMRKARKTDRSIDRVYADALMALKEAVTANKFLRAKKRALPENQRLEYASVQLGWSKDGPYSASFASDIISTYNEWIKKAAAEGNRERVSHLKHDKIIKLRCLADDASALIEGQKKSGLWALKVHANGWYRAANTLSYEACHFKLRTTDDCAKASRFIFKVARLTINDYEQSLNAFHIASLARNVESCLRETRAKR